MRDTFRKLRVASGTQSLSVIPGSLLSTARINRFLDERFAISFLESVREIGLARSKIVGCEITPLAFERGKEKGVLLFKLAVRNASSSSMTHISVVGKFRRSLGGRETFEVACRLWKNGFGAQSHLRICQPIAYVEDSRLMLAHYANGESLGDMLATGRKSFPSLVTRAAQWLAKLHQTVIAAPRTRSVTDEVVKLEEKYERMVRKLKKKRPLLGQRARQVLDEIIQRVGSVDPSAYRLTHGDYLPKNIVSDGSNLTVIDLARICLFDPAKDVGKFIGHTTVRAWKYGTDFNIESLRERFLAGYAEEIPTDFSERIAAYEARSYLKRSTREDDADSALYWLQRAEERLEG